MSALHLKTVTRTQGNNRALKEGEVHPQECVLDFEEVPVLVQAFRRMVRQLEFDVCEMAITTYLCAKAYGKRFTALPVFLVRDFHEAAICYNTTLGIKEPKDLEGREVGVNRGYTVTTGVWARGILASDYGVDLSKVTWVLSGDEHVAEYVPPPNVVPVRAGGDLSEMVATGELAAVINVDDITSPDVAPLIPNAAEAGFKALERTGYYPINHLVVVKDEVLDAHPAIAADIFEAFAESKRRYVKLLEQNAIADPTPVDVMHQRVMQITGQDPLPYGVEPNRPVIEQLMSHALSQKILEEPLAIESLFAENTYGLIG